MHSVGLTQCSFLVLLTFSFYLTSCSRHEAEYVTFNQSDKDLSRQIVKNESENISEYIQNENPEKLKNSLSNARLLNQLLPNGRTPLMEAIYWNKKSMVTLLIEMGSNLDVKDEAGHRAEDYANDKKELLFLLNPTLLTSTRQSLYDSIIKNDITTIKQLLEEGLNLNFLFSTGESPLILTLKTKKESLVRLLLQYPDLLDIDFKDQDHLTASDWAINLDLKRSQKIIENFKKENSNE
ncbi:MAG: hypothetical protein HUU56_03845 [Bdellovibrionaceae bacterium]|nr:hypothetical protein [Pseudobdellovibrionaceae bacterium]